MKVLVAMSGGVDSSAAAVLLKEQGYDVSGAMMLLTGDEDTERARAFCERLGIGFTVLDMRKTFKEKVIEPFCSEYIAAKTPNPCVFCNRHLKFGAFYGAARELGFDAIATGHYARIEKDVSGTYIKQARFLPKDQSYVLWSVPEAVLENTLFPLGDAEDKDEIKKIAAKYGVIPGKESQDICFVKDNDYAGYILSHTDHTPREGNFTSEDGKILGRHKGLIHYTVGQRRGLNVSFGKRAFVLKKDPETDRVVLGEDEKLYKSLLFARDTVMFGRYKSIASGAECTARIRYGKAAEKAVLHFASSDRVKCVFESPVRAPTPGQSVVFYDTDTVMGGGIICAE